MSRAKSVVILGPATSMYKNQFVIKLDFVYGDLDHRGSRTFTYKTEEDICAILTVLAAVPSGTSETEKWLGTIQKEVDKWFDENEDKDYDDLPSEIRAKCDLSEEWPHYEGSSYWFEGSSVCWYDENGIKHDITVEWE